MNDEQELFAHAADLLAQSEAASWIESYRNDVEGGDGMAVLVCVFFCIAHELAAPEWLKRAYIQRLGMVTSHQVESWDEAFGKPFPGKHLKSRRRKMAHQQEMFDEIEREHAKGTASYVELFRKVGKDHGFSKTVCEELYYEHRNNQTLDVVRYQR